MIDGIERLADRDVQQDNEIFAGGSKQNADPVEIGLVLTGQKFSAHTARKALYMSKQMNLTQQQTEKQLENMSHDYQKFQKDMERIYHERDMMTMKLVALMGGENEC